MWEKGGKVRGEEGAGLHNKGRAKGNCLKGCQNTYDRLTVPMRS